MGGREELEALRDRLVKATGPDRALDLALASALVPDVVVGRQRDDDSGSDPYTHWRYTASIDAALGLVERLFPGFWFFTSKGRVRPDEPLFGVRLLHEGWDPDGTERPLSDGEAETLPLAILSALVTALLAHPHA